MMLSSYARRIQQGQPLIQQLLRRQQLCRCFCRSLLAERFLVDGSSSAGLSNRRRESSRHHSSAVSAVHHHHHHPQHGNHNDSCIDDYPAAVRALACALLTTSSSSPPPPPPLLPSTGSTVRATGLVTAPILSRQDSYSHPLQLPLLSDGLPPGWLRYFEELGSSTANTAEPTDRYYEDSFGREERCGEDWTAFVGLRGDSTVGNHPILLRSERNRYGNDGDENSNDQVASSSDTIHEHEAMNATLHAEPVHPAIPPSAADATTTQPEAARHADVPSPLVSSSRAETLTASLLRAVDRNDWEVAARAFFSLEKEPVPMSRYHHHGDDVMCNNINLAAAPCLADDLVPAEALSKMFFGWILNGWNRNVADVFLGYRILRCYRRQLQKGGRDRPPNDAVIDSMVGWYKGLCYQVRYLEPRHRHSSHEIESLVRSLVADIRSLSDDNKKVVFPIFITSLVAQRSVGAGKFARPLFEQLVELAAATNDNGNVESRGNAESSAERSNSSKNNTSTAAAAGDAVGVLDGAYLEHLLAQARYLRRDDLPYPRILQSIVQMGRFPKPWHAVAILDNLFPFLENDLNDVKVVLRALVDLQTMATSGSTAANSAGDDDPGEASRRAYRYVVDPNTLEAIGASAARHGDLDLSLLVWDAVQAMGNHHYHDNGQTSVGVYENLVLVFCARPEHYGSAFTVLAEMEDRGYVASRALIRGMSTRLREETRNLDIAMKVLKDLRKNGFHISASMLNAILSGGAERGDIDRSLSLLDEFPRNDVRPDADSYSFALEALGKHLSRRTRKPAGPEVQSYCLETASSILAMMEDQGVAPTHHVIREYVELLCQTGQVDVATGVVLDSIELETGDAEDGLMPLVNNKVIYRVAMANAKQKKFDEARRLAGCSSEPIPWLLRAIEMNELGEPLSHSHRKRY